MAFREVDFTNIQKSPETVKNLVVIVLIAFIICLLLLVSCLFFFHAYLTITGNTTKEFLNKLSHEKINITKKNFCILDPVLYDPSMLINSD